MTSKTSVFSEMEYRHVEVRACMQIEIEGLYLLQELWNSVYEYNCSTEDLQRMALLLYFSIHTSTHINRRVY